jgi:peptidoglycan hydrolase-like protein with peptidoglycan-binding domain
VKSHVARSASLAAATLAGAVTAVALRGGTPAPAAQAPPMVSTAVVVRTNLATSVLTGGTLGYAPARPVINRLAGIYTGLPAAGATIRPGRPLYRVDDQPAILLTGRTPAWRPFDLGMTGGPDISELQANLIAEGDAAGLLSAPTGQFDVLTYDAVRRWQAAEGYPVTGEIDLGQVIFLPTSLRVGAVAAAVGEGAAPGRAPYQVTTARRAVTVPVNPGLPPVTVGQRVSIVLPSSVTTPGTIAATAPPAQAAGAVLSSAGSGAAGSAALPAGTTAVLTVIPRRPAATGTAAGVPVQVSLVVQSARRVLAVPVSALLALAGGGYGLEVITASGAHRLVAVATGMFAGGRVQVSGPGIAPGLRVVVAQ